MVFFSTLLRTSTRMIPRIVKRENRLGTTCLSSWRKLSSLSGTGVTSQKELDGTTSGIANESYFGYTSGRWLYNEREQLAARSIRFNVDALKKVAADAVGAQRCISMTKAHEGVFNSIYFLKFDNGADIVAKIPFPLVSPRRLCTASEVATMDYARNHLGLSVPKVLGWSARAEENAVGVEYILMERVDGVELHQRYKQFKSEGLFFVQQVNEMERRFSSRCFSQIGSLYYKEDVDPELQARSLYAYAEDNLNDEASERFRIGPYVDWTIWQGTRADVLDADRGPWPNALTFLRATTAIHQKWLKTLAPERSANDLFYHSPFDKSPDAHVRLLDQFLAVLPHLLPPEELCYPVLWHTDLHGANILVKAEGDPTITGVIDWQSMSVGPFFMQSVFAKCVGYEGDDRIVIKPGMTIPKLPADIDTYPEEEKAYLKLQCRMAMLHKMYEVSIMNHSPYQWAAHGNPNNEFLFPAIYSSTRTWYEGSHRLRQTLIDIEESWDEIAPGIEFPIRWDPEELERHRTEYQELKKYYDRIELMLKELDLDPGDGWVSNERYEEVKRKCDELQGSWDIRENGGPFPFQDGAPSWILS